MKSKRSSEQTCVGDATSRLFQVIAHAVCSATDEATVFQGVCDTFITFKGCVQARIGVLDETAPSGLRFVASAGVPQQKGSARAINASRLSSDDTSDTSPLVRAMEIGEPVVCPLTANAFLKRWLAPGGDHGVCAAFPLRRAQARFGVLALTAAETAVFSEHVLPSFQDIADLVAQRIDSLRIIETRAQAHQTQARLYATRYHNLLQTTSDAFLTFSDAFKIIECNKAAERLFDASCELLCSTSIERWFDCSADDVAKNPLHAMLRGALAGEPASATMRCTRSDGEAFDADLKASRFEDLRRDRVLVSICDTTCQKQVALRLLQLTRERTVLSTISQMMVRANSVEALLADGCRALTIAGGYLTSWGVCVENQTGRAFNVLAHGHTIHKEIQAKLQQQDPSRDETIRHPLVYAALNGLPEVCPVDGQGDAILRRCLAGFSLELQACATVPLWDGATLFGALVVGTASHESFMSEEVEFLKELSRSISFGITAVRSRLARVTAEQKRHETSELMRNVIEGSNDFIYIADFEGRYLQFLNSGGLKRYGIAPDRVLGRTPVQVWGAEVGRKALERYQQILARGTITQGEYIVCAVDGSFRHLWVTNGPLRSEDGKLQGVFGVLRDVTDFRQAERILRVNSERLEVLQSLVNTDYDSERDLIRAGMAEIIRITESTIGFFNLVENGQVRIHMQIRRAGETVDAPFLSSQLVLPLASTPWLGCAQTQKTTVVNHAVTPFGDGSVRLTMTRYACVPVVVNNRVEVLAGVANKTEEYEDIDIQQIRLFMESLWQLVLRRRADQQSRLLLAANEQSMSAVLILDAAGTVTYVNSAFEKMHAVQRQELLGEDLGSAKFRAKVGDEVYVHIYDAFSRKDVFVGEMNRKHSDGSISVYEGGIYPVRNASGTITHYASVQRDITEERDLRVRLEQSQKLELVGHLTGGIAHDFNNLLQVINGYSEFILTQMPHEHAFRNEISEIFEAGRRAAHMTGRLLAFSRRQVALQNPVCLNQVIQEIEKMLRRIIGETIELRTVLDPALPDCFADSNQIEQVLLNLCINARDSMPQGGLLTIQTQVETLDTVQAAALKMQPGPTVAISVTDTGLGMTPETMSHLFEPFFTTKASGKGTGLGLATVYGIVMQHNGHIGFSSELGQGSCCTVLLPVLQGTYVADTVENLLVSPTLVGAGEWLIVGEDEDPVRKMLAHTLSTHGYNVLEACTGTDVLRVYKENRAHVSMIVCDVCMPEMGGLEMEIEMRAAYADAPPVLYVTGYMDLADKLRAADTEAEVVLKPVSAEELLGRVKKILDAHPRHVDSKVRAPRADATVPSR